jgi:hypothetical protein
MFVLSPTRPRVRTGIVVLCLTFATWAAPAVPAASRNEASEGEARAKLSRDVLDILDNENAAKADEPLHIIVQGSGRSVLRSLAGDARRSAKALDLIDGMAATVSHAELMSIAKRRGVRRISIDREVASSSYDYNHLRVTTGASQVVGSTGVAPLAGPFGGYLSSLPAGMPSGAGVGVAIVDSGIYDPVGSSTVHRDFKNLNDPSSTRVVTHRDFCSIDPTPAGSCTAAQSRWPGGSRSSYRVAWCSVPPSGCLTPSARTSKPASPCSWGSSSPGRSSAAWAYWTITDVCGAGTS